MPKSPKLSSWKNRDDDGERTSLAAARWENILNKVLALDYDTEAEEKIPHVLSMDGEARNTSSPGGTGKWSVSTG